MPAVQDHDLMLCRDHGIAYQRDRKNVVTYDECYFNKCASYDGKDIGLAINEARVSLVSRYLGQNRVVDVGIGSGEFIRNRPNTWGHDVNPFAIEWLKRNDKWAVRLDYFAGMTMWDVIEHLKDPDVYLSQIPLHGFLFVSVPVVYAVGAVRLSKHYRPGEHLTYFTEDGFVYWMEQYGLRLLERNDAETQAGRESIVSFAFKRYRWPIEY